MKLKIAFLMDPLDKILVDKDTTFVFMLEAQRRGHAIYFLEPGDLFSRGPRVFGRARRCEVARARPHYQFPEEAKERPLEFFDSVFIRKDPPFDTQYLYATLLLSLVDTRRTFLLNNPRGLREANEKLYILNFPSLIPPTLVTRQAAQIRDFMLEQGGVAVVKPLDGHGGESVFVLSAGDRNFNAIVEAVTHNYSRTVMVQRYLPEARDGDKRLLVLNGEPLGATLRVPPPDENRGNIHVGGTCIKAPITERDREICRTMAPRLRSDGLYFVGLDIIGDFLTEANVTSPTGMQEIDRLESVCLEEQVIDFVEQQVKELRS